MPLKLAAAVALFASTAALAAPPASGPTQGVDKLTYHVTPQRIGWNAQETALTPRRVAGKAFGLVWQSPQLDAFKDTPPRLFASPLYVHAMSLTRGPHRGKRLSIAYVVTTTGYAYAINTQASGDLAPGAILWRTRLTETPCDKGTLGNLSTPVIDRARSRIYVTSCSGTYAWKAHALDLQTGEEASGWPTAITPEAMNAPGLNHNGATKFVDGQIYFQRGALNLSPDGGRLYLAFGPDFEGWLVSIDTRKARILSAFSTTPINAEEQGGMWGSSGPSVDKAGRVHVVTGSNFSYALAKRGIPGVFPDSAHSWGQSILQFTDTPQAGLTLVGTYTPYNYCLTASQDIDIASSGAVLIDLPAGSTTTPHLLALGGAKQGNAYLLDRDHMPGGVVKRHPCSEDPTSDGSLLAPEIQPALKTRGPINVFGPFSDHIGMTNSAKSRSTLAYFHDDRGENAVYLTGSSKTGADYSINVPPGLAKLKLVTTPGQPAFLRIDRLEPTQTFQNPGSPIVSSHGGRDGIVWVMDTNAPRSVDLFRPDAPHATLYAFDAKDLKLLWKSGAELYTSGKYNEPAVVDGQVLVGTDRLQAFGYRTASTRVEPPPVASRTAPAKAQAAEPAGKTLFEAHCSGCHSVGAGGAPSIATLSGFSHDKVVQALTTGKMQPMASGLSAADIQDIAGYLKSIQP